MLLPEENPDQDTRRQSVQNQPNYGWHFGIVDLVGKARLPGIRKKGERDPAGQKSRQQTEGQQDTSKLKQSSTIFLVRGGPHFGLLPDRNLPEIECTGKTKCSLSRPDRRIGWHFSS
jgi:hypothetical protein